MLLNCGARKTLESPLASKEIKPVKGNQPWIFIGRTDAEAEAPILGPANAKNWLTGKNHNAGKDWGQEKKKATEDKMVRWYHWLNGHELEQAPGDSEGQRSLACPSPWVSKTQLGDWKTTIRVAYMASKLTLSHDISIFLNILAFNLYSNYFLLTDLWIEYFVISGF